MGMENSLGFAADMVAGGLSTQNLVADKFEQHYLSLRIKRLPMPLQMKSFSQGATKRIEIKI